MNQNPWFQNVVTRDGASDCLNPFLNSGVERKLDGYVLQCFSCFIILLPKNQHRHSEQHEEQKFGILSFKLSRHAQGLFYPKDVASQVYMNVWTQGWVSAHSLNLQGDEAVEWRQYVKTLVHSATKLSREEDRLWWSKNLSTSDYTAR